MNQANLFNGTHYTYWAEEARAILIDKGLWDAIENPRRFNGQSNANRKALALGTLTGLMTREVRARFPGSTDAFSLWMALRSTYNNNNSNSSQAGEVRHCALDAYSIPSSITTTSEDDTNSILPQCQFCDQSHWHRDCPDAPICYHCGIKGHIIRNCRFLNN